MAGKKPQAKPVSNKDKIIAAYLGGEGTFVILGKLYGVPQRTIQTWVRAYRINNGLDSRAQALNEARRLDRQAARLASNTLKQNAKASLKQAQADTRKAARVEAKMAKLAAKAAMPVKPKKQKPKKILEKKLSQSAIHKMQKDLQFAHFQIAQLEDILRQSEAFVGINLRKKFGGQED